MTWRRKGAADVCGLRIGSLILSLFFAVDSFAGAKELPRLPPPQFLDTEVTAYYRFNQDCERVRTLDFSLSFNGTPSNNVEVAFGTDADHDGRLAPHETGVVIGWESGRYFIERFRTGERTEEPSVGAPAARRRLEWHCKVADNRTEFVSFAATNDFGAVFADLSSACPRWLYDRDWNLVRMTARGLDTQSERFLVDVDFRGFSVSLR